MSPQGVALGRFVAPLPGKNPNPQPQNWRAEEGDPLTSLRAGPGLVRSRVVPARPARLERPDSSAPARGGFAPLRGLLAVRGKPGRSWLKSHTASLRERLTPRSTGDRPSWEFVCRAPRDIDPWQL